MILLNIRVHIYPHKQQEFMQTLHALNAEKRPTDVSPHYDIYQGIEQKNVFYLTSHWQTREALELHFQSRNFGVLLGAMQVLGDASDIQVNTVSHTDGVDTVHAIRDKRSVRYGGNGVSNERVTVSQASFS